MGLVADPTVAGLTMASPSTPLIQTSGGNFGFRNHQFGFNVVSTNATLVVEACTNIAGGAWDPSNPGADERLGLFQRTDATEQSPPFLSGSYAVGLVG